jgi:hypothetical protein
MAALVVVVACGRRWRKRRRRGRSRTCLGRLSAKRADGTSKLLSVKSEVMEGDTLGTESETYARVKFNDGGEVVMRPGTQLKIESYSYNAAKPESDSIVMSMFKGGLRAVTGLIGKRNREKVSFQTETATIGIRGTHFGALAVPERLRRGADHGRDAAAERAARGCDERGDHDEQPGGERADQRRAIRFCGEPDTRRRRSCRRNRGSRSRCRVRSRRTRAEAGA